MSENKPHKHAKVIHAWADGAEVQIRHTPEKEWQNVCEPIFCDEYEYRVKPKTININGFEVPEPVKEPLTVGKRFFIPNLAVTHPQSTLSSFTFWRGVEADMIWLQRGLIHLTEEAAIEHAKALLVFTAKK